MPVRLKSWGIGTRRGTAGGRVHRSGSRRELGVLEVTLMTVGGIVGSGLFLASGQAIHDAGPAVAVAYVIGATAMAIELMALAEMSAADPERGSFLTYARRVLGPGATFVGGWIFWFSSVLNMAAEATAAATFARLWFTHVPVWVFAVGFSLFIIGINFLAVKGFGEVESTMSAVKVLATLGFVAVAALAIFGVIGHRGPAGTGLGVFTRAGGFFPHGVRGVGAAMILVMFSMAGTGVLGLASPSIRRPERTMGPSILATVGTVYLIYTASALGIVGLTVWNRVPAHTKSPFISALHTLPFPWLADVMNVVILFAVLSAMNAGLFATDRVLSSLARAGDAPRRLGRVSGGVPRTANAVTGAALALVSVLAYFLPKTAYLYLVTATGFQAIFVWILIVVTQIYYRRHILAAGRRPRFLLPLHPYLSWFEVALLVAIIATAPLAPRQILPLGLGVFVSLVFLGVYLALRGRRRAAAAG